MSSKNEKKGIEMLWAPWRLEYVKGERPAGCPFCESPKEEPSEENLVLFKNDVFFVVMNKFPYNPGHLMVIPRRHVTLPTDLSIDEWSELSHGLRAVLDVLNSEPVPHGYNLGMNLGAVGGAGIPGHLHWHVLPRWAGDTNFMPLIAETKALPTHNVTVYRRLKPFFDTFASRLKKV
jgi:ATP adenylyltransferase